jgi:hypothetical protein
MSTTLLSIQNSPLRVLADDQGAHDAVGNLVHTVKLGREIRCALKIDEHIIPLGKIVDGIGESPLSPLALQT